MVGHHRARRQRVDVAEREVPHVAELLATEISPEQRITFAVAPEGSVVPGPGQEIEQPAVDAGDAVRAPVDGLAQVAVVRHRERIVAVELPELFDREGGPIAQRRRGRRAMEADLESACLEVERPGEIVRILARDTAEPRLPFAANRPDGLGRAEPEVVEEGVDAPHVVQRGEVRVIEDRERERFPVRPLDRIVGPQTATPLRRRHLG